MTDRPTRCVGCARTVRDAKDSDRWYAMTLTRHVCPECQTPEQREIVAEMQIAYGVLDQGGVVFGVDEQGRPVRWPGGEG